MTLDNATLLRAAAWALGHELQRDSWDELSCIYCRLVVPVTCPVPTLEARGRCPGIPPHADDASTDETVYATKPKETR